MNRDRKTSIRVKALLLVVAVAASLFSGCGIVHRATEEDLLWPDGMSGVRVQWTADPGIELTEGIALPVRAYLESYDLVMYTGKIDNAYPGFLEAVPPNEPTNDSKNRAAWDRRPYEHYSDAGATFAGNLGFHIRSVRRERGSATVTVCKYSYALGVRRYDGAYDPVVFGGPSVERGTFGVRLNLVAPSDEETPLPPQHGPAVSPAVNVFGGWQITGFRTTSGAAPDEWPNKDQVVADCVATAPDPLEQRNRLARDSLTAADFAPSPTDPGWPK